MFCPSCGKQIPDGSKFCLHCGKATSGATSSKPVEWEYKDFLLSYAERNGGRFETDNILEAKRGLWNINQAKWLPILQKELDSGWEPITEVGPSALKVRWHGGGLLGLPW